ncbi:hypothetical protein Q3G72_002796 [Acer saccharum]|nr:hypothetical protein Q3G72_023157 [Acer saccharum]KAK1581072.1 hypothetical protein Q3G72_002796 [Acer saccharum]
MAEQSKVLNTPGAEKQTKRELFDALRQELEEPLLFPLPNVKTQPCKETEKGKEKGKEKEHENEKDNSNSALKKRRYTEMNEEGGDNKVAK